MRSSGVEGDSFGPGALGFKLQENQSPFRAGVKAFGLTLVSMVGEDMVEFREEPQLEACGPLLPIKLKR